MAPQWLSFVFCTSFPQITEDVRAYARDHGYGVDEKVFEVGMENMSKEFAKVGQVYTEETELAKKLGKEWKEW